MYKSSNLVFCSTGNIDTLSTGGLFYLQKGKVAPLEHTVDNKVTALARLTFYENLLVGQKKCSLSVLTNVRPGFILRKCKGFLSPGAKQIVRNNDVFVLSGNPLSRVRLYQGETEGSRVTQRSWRSSVESSVYPLYLQLRSLVSLHWQGSISFSTATIAFVEDILNSRYRPAMSVFSI